MKRKSEDVSKVKEALIARQYKLKVVKSTDKTAFLATLAFVWNKYPNLSFGQLITLAVPEKIYNLTDDKIEAALKIYDPSRPGKCKAWSPSRISVCSLYLNHHGRHTSYETGNTWIQ